MNRNASRPARVRRDDDLTRARDEARARNLAQTNAVRDRHRAEQRDRDQALRAQQRAVDDALGDYLDAAAAIATTEATTEAAIADLEAAVVRARDLAAAAIADHRRQQALAAYRIQQAGRRVNQVAELLDLSRGKTAQLIATGRTTDTGAPAESAPGGGDSPQRGGVNTGADPVASPDDVDPGATEAQRHPATGSPAGAGVADQARDGHRQSALALADADGQPVDR